MLEVDFRSDGFGDQSELCNFEGAAIVMRPVRSSVQSVSRAFCKCWGRPVVVLRITITSFQILVQFCFINSLFQSSSIFLLYICKYLLLYMVG